MGRLNDAINNTDDIVPSRYKLFMRRYSSYLIATQAHICFAARQMIHELGVSFIHCWLIHEAGVSFVAPSWWARCKKSLTRKLRMFGGLLRPHNSSFLLVVFWMMLADCHVDWYVYVDDSSNRCWFHCDWINSVSLSSQFQWLLLDWRLTYLKHCSHEITLRCSTAIPCLQCTNS